MTQGPNPKALDALGSLKVRRESAESAEYMELPKALKGGDCEKVEVDGGVSPELGCCDRFELANNAPKQFRCGTCEYFIPSGA
jgi:hypothetical protein